MEESRQEPHPGTETSTNHSRLAVSPEQDWLECLTRLAVFSSEHDNLIEVVRYTYRLLRPLLGPDAFMVSLYHTDEDEVEHIYAVVDDHEVSLKGHKARNKLIGNRIEPMIRGRKTVLVDNWQAEEQHNYQVVSLGQNPPRVHTLLDIPLLVGNVALGGLHLQSYRYKAWGEAEIEFAQTVAALLVGAVLQYWIVGYRNSKKSYASCLHAIARECSTTAPIEEIGGRVIEIIARFIGGICTLLLKQGDEVKLGALFHSDPVMRMMQTEFTTHNLDMLLASGWAMPLRTGEVVLVPKVDKSKTPGHKWLAETGLGTLAATPLLLHGQVVGQISIARFAPSSSLREYDVRLLEAAGVYLALAMENEQLRAGRLAGKCRGRQAGRAT